MFQCQYDVTKFRILFCLWLVQNSPPISLVVSLLSVMIVIVNDVDWRLTECLTLLHFNSLDNLQRNYFD